MMKQNQEKTSLKDDIKVAVFILRKAAGYSKGLVAASVFTALFKTAVPFLNIIMPKLIIDELTGGKRPEQFLILVSITVVLNLVFYIVSSSLNQYIDLKNTLVQHNFHKAIGKKSVEMDYMHIENPKVLEIKERALSGMNEAGGVIRIIDNSREIFSRILTFIGVTYVLFYLNPFIILLLLAIVAINALIEKIRNRNEFIYWGKNAENFKVFSYLASLVNDYKAGKDIRMYNVSEMIMDRYREHDRSSLKLSQQNAGSYFRYSILFILLKQVQMVSVYGYLVYRLVSSPGIFTIGSFTMYVGAANLFTQSISDILNFTIRLQYNCKYLKLYKDFLELEDIMVKGNLPVDITPKHTLEFRDVSFKYPGSDIYMLKNFSLIIPAGQRLAVVGMNGAGKTTLVKLLLRFYDPQNGEVLLDGKNIKALDYTGYHKLFSAVFQDFKLLSFTMKENVAIDDVNADDKKIIEVLEKAGLDERLKRLEKGIYTSVNRDFDQEGVEFSGGENQKLAIARAIYKDAPVIILDEPTASLDPIAEHEIYSRFNELISGKTAIYISHRLSSCRFCDRIAVIHKGELVQYGTHDDLMKEPSGTYARLFNTQAQYYLEQQDTVPEAR